MLLITDKPSAPKQTKPTIAVSTFALYDLVNAIGGKAVDVFMIVPFGVDVHSFEPTPRDLARLSKSTLFVFSGAGLEPWATTFSNSVKSLDISQSVTLLPMDHHDVMHETSHGHHHERVDPHYWLDMHNMVRASKVIEKALIAIVPGDTDSVQHNTKRYIQRLLTIDKRFDSGLSRCKTREVIVNHNAFGYLAHRYGFEVTALTGLSPEAMPSAKTMAMVVDTVQEKQISTIFFESFVSDRLISTIAAETGARVEVLHPLANITADEIAAGADFESLMIDDLNKISRAMECN